MRARVYAAVMVMLAAAGLAGCAARPGGVDRAVGPSIVHDRWISCAAVSVPRRDGGSGAEATALPRLSGEFVPIAAVVCDVRPQPTGRGGEDLVEVEGRTEEIAGLLAALRLPDQPISGNCRADLPTVPWFALLDADGRWVQPGVPVDVCGKIRIEVRDALAALDLTTTSTRTLREITSDAAAAAGCSQVSADMVSVESRLNPEARPGPGANPLAGAAKLRLCAYRVPAAEQGSGKPAGDFEYGLLLDPRRRAAIETSLVAARPARRCSTPAGRFVILQSADGYGDQIYIELDGCQRIMITGAPDTGVVLAQADAALISLLGKE